MSEYKKSTRIGLQTYQTVNNQRSAINLENEQSSNALISIIVHCDLSSRRYNECFEPVSEKP